MKGKGKFLLFCVGKSQIKKGKSPIKKGKSSIKKGNILTNLYELFSIPIMEKSLINYS